MKTERVSALSDAPVEFTVAADVDGLPYDPRSSTVEMAALAGFGDPAGGDWHPGSWDVSVIGAYTAEFNPGPSGAALPKGTYFVWIRITDPLAGVTLIDPTGQLVVQ